MSAANGHIPIEQARERLLKREHKVVERNNDEWRQAQLDGHMKTGSWRPLMSRYVSPKDGYILIKIAHGQGKRNWVAEHRYVMEQHLGRSLLRAEHVHHIDGNPANNNLENLVVLSNREHFVLNKILQFIRDKRGGKRFAETIIKTIVAHWPELSTGQLPSLDFDHL